VLSAGSALSLASFLSFASAGSVMSIGSSGSILSIGSSGSVLSIGAAGGFLQIGRGPAGTAGYDVAPFATLLAAQLAEQVTRRTSGARSTLARQSPRRSR